MQIISAMPKIYHLDKSQYSMITVTRIYRHVINDIRLKTQSIHSETWTADQIIRIILPFSIKSYFNSHVLTEQNPCNNEVIHVVLRHAYETSHVRLRGGHKI